MYKELCILSFITFGWGKLRLENWNKLWDIHVHIYVRTEGQGFLLLRVHKNCQISLKLPIQWQQPNNRLSDVCENFTADSSWPFWPLVRFALKALVSEIYAKNCILPQCSIFSQGCHFDLWAMTSGSFLKLDTLRMI